MQASFMTDYTMLRKRKACQYIFGALAIFIPGTKGKRKLSGRVYDGATKSEDYARDG